MDYIVSRDKNFKRLSPKEQKEAKKQVDEYFRKKGWLAPEMTSAEKAELDRCAKEASNSFETFRKDTHRRQGVSIPFPLDDIFYYTSDGAVPADGVYDHDDPEYLERLSVAAYGAINDYLTFFYKPELCFNKEQLKIATDVALKIRADKHDLRNIPLAEKPNCPTEQDFIQLGQWFLDANTAIKAEIASGSNAAKENHNKDPLKEKQSVIKDKGCWHSEDFLSVVWYGKEYDFNKTQALCVKILWDNGRLSEKTIGEKIGSVSENYRLIHTFRGEQKNHPAWGKMIVSDGKGIYKLSEKK